MNEPQSSLEYAQKHLELRLQVGKRDTLLGLAYNELGYALSINDVFDESIKTFETSLSVYSELPEVKSGEYRPDFPRTGLALVLCEVGRLEESAQMMLESIAFRAERYGPDDTESLK